jgi:hypothetical protein
MEQLSTSISKNLLIANTVAEEAGGLNNDQDSYPTLINCTFSNNSAGRWGGGGKKGNFQLTISGQ